jgi:hypothetical protein
MSVAAGADNAESGIVDVTFEPWRENCGVFWLHVAGWRTQPHTHSGNHKRRHDTCRPGGKDRERQTHGFANLRSYTYPWDVWLYSLKASVTQRLG